MASEGLFLRVTKGEAAGTEIPLEDGLLFGRNAAGDGSLGGDSELSREHANFQQEPGGGFLIRDLGSMNGTFVNGTRIKEAAAIRPGDVILLGASELLELAGALPRALNHGGGRETDSPAGGPADPRCCPAATGAHGGTPRRAGGRGTTTRGRNSPS